MFDLLSEVKSFFLTLPKKPRRVLLGVSGGIDSMVLLDVLAKLRFDLGFELFASHLDHGLRGDSALDREFVERECHLRGVACFSKRVCPPSSNIEAWGREERYKFFNELFKEHDCDYLVTAHHKDDLVETFLFRLLSGRFNSMGQAIKAFDETRNLIRPLIDVSKEQILEFAKENKIPYREDSTNADQTYRRNFIRHSISPVLKEFEPTCLDHICEYVSVVGEMEGYVLGEAEKYVGASLEEMQALHKILLQKVLYLECARTYAEDAFKISKDRMDELVHLIKDPREYKRECDLGFGLYAVVDRVGAENAGVRFLKRESGLERKEVVRVSEREFDFNFGRELSGIAEFFLNKKECMDLSVAGINPVQRFFHAFPIKNLDDLDCEFLSKTERVSIGAGKTRSVSKIFKDEGWNEERRYCAVLLRKGEEAFLLGARFYSLDSSLNEDEGYIYCRFSIIRE